MDKSMLADATSSDDSPTPGYMLAEISRQTLSNYNACTQLQEYLIARLAKKHYNIKYKCLVIIKSVCRSGRPEFKRDMGRNTDAIKECLQFKGDPDPLRGDEIYRRVRDMAKETLEAIYDSQAPVTTSTVAPRISGLGHNVAPVEPGAQGTSSMPPIHGGSTWQPPPAAGASKYTGFGNPHMPAPTAEKSWMETAKDMADKAKQAVGNAFNSNDAHRFDAAPLPGSMSSSSGGGPIDYSYNHATNRGANAYGVSNQGYVPSTDVHPRGGMVDDSLTQGKYGGAGGANSDGSYERQLVEDLCEPGGTKAIPPEDKLQSLLTSAPTLDEELLCPVLSEQLVSDSWQSIVKALIVCASLAKTKGCEHHAEWLAANDAERIKGMSSDSKLSIRQQAMKTTRALSKFGGNAPAIKINGGSASNSAPSSVDLLDTGGESMMPPPPPVPQMMPGVAVNVLEDMSGMPVVAAGGLFDGMAVGTSVAQAPEGEQPTASLSAFSFISSTNITEQQKTKETNSPMAPAPMKEDPFDFLDNDPSSSSSSSSSVPIDTMPSSMGALNPSFGGISDGINSMPPTPQVPNSTMQFTSMNDGSKVLNDLSSLDLNSNNSSGMQMNMNMNNMAAVNPQLLAAQNAQLQMQMQQMQQQMMMQQQMQQQSIGGNLPMMAGNPMGLGTMGSFSTIRTNIPSADDVQQGNNNAGSGFSFLNNAGDKKGSGDSFSFVNDAMKASKK